MKKIFLSFVIAAFLLVSSVSFAGVVDVRFADAQINGDKFNVIVQVKAQTIDFELGSATVFFSYNTKAINNPSSASLNFSDANKCAQGGTTSAYTNSFNYLQSNTEQGEVNYAILLKQANQACPTVTSEWVDVARFSFDVIDASMSPDLTVNKKYTAFNTVENNGSQHAIGDVYDLDEVTSIGEVVNTTGITIFPNYTADQINVQYTTDVAGDVNITLYDMFGRAIKTIQKNLGVGQYSETINMGGFSNGYYLIEVDNGTTTITDKILLTK